MSSRPEPGILSRETGQWIPCLDSCQSIITGTSNIKDVPMAMLSFFLFSRTDGHVTTKNFEIEVRVFGTQELQY